MDEQEEALCRFGRQLSRLREAQGVGIAELASRSGLDAGDLAAIEAGKKDIHIADMFRLAEALGIRVSELLASL
jgi:transcriptional regulator with XRE-family HTH domain